MLDIKFIRENPDLVKTSVKNKLGDIKWVDEVLQIDEKKRQIMTEVETIRAQRNQLSKSDQEQGKILKEKLKSLEPQLSELDSKLDLAMRHIPNIPSENTPIGKDDTENIVIRKWGEPKKLDFTPKDHLELGEKLSIVNMDMAGKISGARYGYIMGDLAMMEFALVQLAMRITAKNGFMPVVPPVMIKPETYIRMARLDPGQEEERFYMPNDNMYLIGSAEHTLGPLHMDQVIEEKKFPIRYVGFSTCFRREAGSYGKDTKGMIRMHQFDKVEMESFSIPENGVAEQELMVSIQEEIMQALNLPYQVVSVCTGDMGGPDARQIDIETWMPAQNKYRETHSADYMTDYQSRRLQTRVKRSTGAIEYVHMNDATAIAIGRTLVAIMENYQNADGTITVPQVLRPYMGKDTITGK